MPLWATVGAWADPVEVNTMDGAMVSGDGLCSLPEAVHLANNGTDDGYGCPAYDYGPVTVTFPGLAGTITVPGGLTLLPRYGPLTIVGPGADQLTIDFAGHSGFETGSNGEIVTLRGMTLTHASTFAVRAYGPDTITVEDCAIVDNTSTGNGAGIRNKGTVNVVRSVFTGNTCTGTSGPSDGAAIWSEGDLTVVDSSFSGNSSLVYGGAIEVGADGTARLVNVTISGNSAPFGAGLSVLNAFGHKVGPSVDLVNVTITDNHATASGGGINLSAGNGLGEVRIRGSVVAGNTADGGFAPDCSSSLGASGTVVSGGHNRLGIDEDCGMVGGPGDAAGTVAAPLDPLLAALAENGSLRATHRPLAGSPLVDAIDVADCVDDLGAPLLADQRGFARPSGARCDIGAHEIGCGDGVTDDGEQCDDGNLDDADGCTSACTLTDTGPKDTGTTPTDPGTTDPGGDPPCCKEDSTGCGCASGAAAAPAAVLSIAGIGLLVRRARRSAPT